MELDWKPGKFFDAEGEYLICSTHGALYAPESGACRGGPVPRRGLARLEVEERDGKVYCERLRTMAEDSGTGNANVIEKLAFAALKEQSRARRWGIFFKLLDVRLSHLSWSCCSSGAATAMSDAAASTRPWSNSTA